MQIAAAGDRALLLTVPGASSARLRAIAERSREIAGVVAAIVGHESVYVIGTSDADALRRAADAAIEIDAGPQTRHRINVSFAEEHALDLGEFLSHVRLSREEFLRRVPAVTLSVRYLGFRPGWAYLEGWPEEWAMPRRPTSRNVVPGGSFAIAGTVAGFYPEDCPGGWNILGRTDAVLWDVRRQRPNLFSPGDEVTIEPVPHIEPRLSRFAPAESRHPVAEVIAPGQLTTIVGPRDWTRLDHGEPPGGPFDEDAAAIANAAVGNPSDAPLLECVLVGPKLKTDRRVAFVDADLNVRETADVGRIRGMRGYLAIEGGLHNVGSVLRKGDVLDAATPRPRESGREARVRRALKEILIKPGPHDAPPLPEEWEVTPFMNRIGIRLRSLQALDVKLPADLPSLGAQFGTLQWHPDGSLVALGPDHPVTGGYLQPATVISSELWKLGQLAPGDRIRLIA
ncbi:MAG TPA: carboxyltransferase domain-containing protein, partial [Thermoanaerobaculia bacterium]|nr:carboxyltransferase domain-containing protein [Thermoanaerobaculia bacterium]